MKATLTSKGQITIPLGIRNRLRLKPGVVFDFDESAPFLKATKTIPPGAWETFGGQWKDPWPGKGIPEVLEELRGAVELPLQPKSPPEPLLIPLHRCFPTLTLLDAAPH